MKKIKFITGKLKKTFRTIKENNKLLGYIGTNMKYKTLTDEEEEILMIFSLHSSYSPEQIRNMYLKSKKSYDKVRWLIHESVKLNKDWRDLGDQPLATGGIVKDPSVGLLGKE